MIRYKVAHCNEAKALMAAAGKTYRISTYCEVLSANTQHFTYCFEPECSYRLSDPSFACTQPTHTNTHSQPYEGRANTSLIFATDCDEPLHALVERRVVLTTGRLSCCRTQLVLCKWSVSYAA
eukprot:4519230-Pleurochrysis_carterae.AAC.1